jgi:hypothetical protein
MSSIIDGEPSSYASVQVWQEAMVEESNSIMKNDEWEIVLRRKGKSVVDSR